MNQTPQQSTPGPVDIVIMAAGKGTRMKSALPKVLHRLAGPRTARARGRHRARRIGARDVVVVTGHGASRGRGRAGRRIAGATLQLRAPGAAARHRPRRAAGGAAAARRRHGAGAVRRRAADRPTTRCARSSAASAGRAAGAADHRARRPHRLRPHRARRRRPAMRPPSSSRRTPREAPARRSARSTPASWRCRRACSSAGWRGWTTTTRRASTT